ncbi:hypothetical protein KJS94_11295 [Flavihumibacter rivuli]|uniref:hypothetical protein n=1 Tax=Flavihumibacter rivuli TaxID=2838156 RepID=UPI001BDE1130|nr:hypothetical protein [Flavihumibacter rivuli]ULQ55227.1 hypothetical protein KJS94_11295 [Flavihumibacter rivuli]
MNTNKIFIALLLFLGVLAGCQKDKFEDTSFVDRAATPGKLSALFDITQDNTGLVTITPNGEGISYFLLYYGDGTAEPVKLQPGQSTRHRYEEGNYEVRILGIGINGATTEAKQPLTVSFKEPENFEINAVIDPANVFQVNLSAKADYETLFKVYFGDEEDEVPQSFQEGETISHIYKKTGTYTIRVIALSGGAATKELTKEITILNPVLLPIDFEIATQPYPFINFDGGNTTVINNPHPGGLNASARVGKMVKSPGQPWGGSLISLGGPIDFSTNKIFRMKVYSPRVGAKVLLKVENATNGSISFEKEVQTTKDNEWEELGFDFRDINTSNSYQNIVLIFELGTPGDGSANFTFYFDDIRLTNTLPGLSQINLPVNFDTPGINYAVTDFGGNETVDGTDPANSSNKVKVTTKPNGAQTWAGTTIGTPIGFASKIPVTASASKMSVRVYSPAAGLTIKLKIEDHTNGAVSVETDVVTTKANQWETLVFNFLNHSAGTPAFNAASNYDKASIFFDFGNTGNGKVFYWDDVKMAEEPTNPNTLGLPLNFQSSTLNYNFLNFDGGNASVVDNPNASGINTSSKVGKMVKGGGQPWGGAFISLDAPINFSAGKTFKVKVLSPRVGAKLLLKVENQNDGGISFEKEVATTKSGEWEELSFDFSAINIANSYQKIVLIFDLGTVGDGSANFTYYFDDITLN